MQQVPSKSPSLVFSPIRDLPGLATQLQRLFQLVQTVLFQHANAINGNIANSGSTGQRPPSALEGQMFWDTTLGKPIWWDGVSHWRDATGAIV